MEWQPMAHLYKYLFKNSYTVLNFCFVMKIYKHDSYTGGIFSCLVSNFKLELQELR